MGRRIRKPSKRLLAQLAANKRRDWTAKRLKAQDGRCYWCGAKVVDPTCDHLIPLSRGGRDHFENVVAAHVWCNEAKADSLPEEFAEPGAFDAREVPAPPSDGLSLDYARGEKPMEKIVRDGKVAVIVSPGFGAGWYSWSTDQKALLFDPQLVSAVEAGDHDAITARAEEIDPGGYHSTSDLQIQWVSEGFIFRIDEYDGSESLVIQADDDWIVA